MTAVIVGDREQRTKKPKDLLLLEESRKRPFDRTFKCVGEWAIV